MPPPVYKTAHQATVTITRPSNTTDYTAADVVGQADATIAANAGNAIHTLSGIGPTGGFVKITDVSLQLNASSIPSGMTTHTLHLYDTSPTAILDNAAWDFVTGDRNYYLGSITIPQIVDQGSTCRIESTGLSKIVKLASGSNTLYAELVTVGAYTPVSGAVYILKVTAVDA